MAAPLFILSFRHRDELSALFERAGWQPIAARRGQGAEGRFLASGAAVAIVDARGALKDGLDAVRALAAAAETNAAALLVLLSRTDAAAAEEVHALGATHFLVSPFADEQLVHATRFALRHSERLGGAARGDRRHGAGAPSWRWDGSNVELGPAMARKAGRTDASGARVPLMELFRRLGPDGRKAARAAVERTMATGAPTAFAHDDAEAGRMAHHLRLEGGQVVARSEVLSAANMPPLTRDPLTGLRDGVSARRWIAARLAEPAGSPPLIAILLSVSRYDAINAAFGRAAGDAVLQAVAARLERLVEGRREACLVARMAGAEFAILVGAPAQVSDAHVLARQAVEAVARPFASGEQAITLASRAGLAPAEAGDDAAALLRRASLALAEARGNDAAPVQVLDQSAEQDSALTERLAVDLRRALADDEIGLLYQPQVSMATGALVGVEALARWNHPQLGELGAGTLFDVAERSDYVAQLSEHVQRKALRDAAAWPDALSHLRLSVNVTSVDMARPGFAAHFLELVHLSGFPHRRLTVEVTESGLIDDLGAAANLLAALRSGALRVAIDDFGTGYSSLAYLKALPLDYLKIDKKLSEDITGSARDRVVVRGVIDMARALGLTVIAEGVETREQLGLLAQEGCNLYQGFLCAPPLDTSALLALVGARTIGAG